MLPPGLTLIQELGLFYSKDGVRLDSLLTRNAAMPTKPRQYPNDYTNDYPLLTRLNAA